MSSENRRKDPLYVKFCSDSQELEALSQRLQSLSSAGANVHIASTCKSLRDSILIMRKEIARVLSDHQHNEDVPPDVLKLAKRNWKNKKDKVDPMPLRDFCSDIGTWAQQYEFLKTINPTITKAGASRALGCDPIRLTPSRCKKRQ